MADDCIPSPDGDFHIRQMNFVAYVSTHLLDFGLIAEDLTPVTAAQAALCTSSCEH